MGMFTIVIHPKDGRELQIKTGNDLCDTYRVGDAVPFSVDAKYAGVAYFEDGIYESFDHYGFGDWVVIRGGFIDAVEFRKAGEKDADGEYQRLYDKYEIQPLPKNLWSSEAWERHRLEQEEHDREFAELKAKYPDDPMKAALMMFVKPMRQMMNGPSIVELLSKK